MNGEPLENAAGRVRSRTGIRRCRGLALAALLDGRDVDPALIDAPERQAERARLLGRDDIVAEVGHDVQASQKLFEAVVGTDDRVPRRFLAEGERAARPVGRIAVAASDGGGALFGTGSLISPYVVLTNHHVLSSPDAIASAWIQFDYYDAAPGSAAANPQSFRLRPDELFLTSEELDFTLVYVEPSNGVADTSIYGTLDLSPRSGRALVGENVNVVQHGGGRQQSLSIRSNLVVDVFDDWIHYTSDTEGGSSGAPVFNDDWQLVAIHHAAVRSTSLSGSNVVVNEGIRVSSIVQRLLR